MNQCARSNVLANDTTCEVVQLPRSKSADSELQCRKSEKKLLLLAHVPALETAARERSGALEGLREVGDLRRSPVA